MNDNVNTTAKASKRKGRFNLIDFLLILVVLLIAASLVYMFFPSSWLRGLLAEQTTEIQYTVEFKGVDESFLENINENDIILNSVTKSNLGTVTAVDYSTQYTELEYNETDQSGVLSVFPNKYNVIVTITATADYTAGEGYTVNGTRVAVGEKISARFPNFVGEGYCISVPVK